MKLYGVKPSPFVRKARVALEEKGLPYELETMVPVLEDRRSCSRSTRWARSPCCGTARSWCPTRR